MTENERQEMLKDIRDGYIDDWDNMAIDELFEQIEKEHIEIQRYHELGTTTEIIGQQYELQTFHAVGTIEEFKALKEKSKPKKAKWKFDDFTAKFGNPYHCSNCDEEFEDTYNYCPNCGCDMYAD